jgi:hypothetical protein
MSRKATGVWVSGLVGVFAAGMSGAAFADGTAQDVRLSHTTPAAVISMLHWDDASKRPAGIQSITADKATNSLHVVGTPDGVAEVETLVSFVDVPVRQVRVDVSYVLARAADVASYDKKAAAARLKSSSSEDFLMNASAPLVARILADLTKKGDVVCSPEIQTANNKEAVVKLEGLNIVRGFPEVEALSFSVSPRVNQDASLTLPLNLSVTIGGAGAAGEVPDGQSAEQVFNVVRTVKDGQTFVAANLAHTGAGNDAKMLLAFVTPHIGDLK